MKRLLLTILLATLTYAALESVGYVAYRLLVGEWFRVSAGIDQQPDGESPAQDAPKELVNRGMGEMAVHPYLGYAFDPAKGEAKWVNPYGFIDKPNRHTSGSDQGDEFVVGVFGGSVANQFYWQGRYSFMEELRKIPELKDRTFTFVSGAVGGYKQPQQLMTLAYLQTLGKSFDLIIVLDGFNEIGVSLAEDFERDVFVLYPRLWDSFLRAPDHARNRLLGRVQLLGDWKDSVSGWGTHGLPAYSPLLASVRELAIRLLNQWQTDAQQDLDASDSGGSQRSFQQHGPPNEANTPDAAYQFIAQAWARASAQMRAMAAQTGASYIHFLQPNQYFPESKVLSDEERRKAYLPDHRYGKHVPGGYAALLQQASYLKDQGVTFHDLSMIFVDNSETLYEDTCCHFNGNGLALLGKAMGVRTREMLLAQASSLPAVANN